MLKKIAIFHDLRIGGAMVVVEKIKKGLENLGIQVVTYSPESNKPYKNFLEELFDVLYKLRKEEKIIAGQIYQENFDCVLIFPSLRIQSPYLITYLKKNNQKFIYFFQEPKREFYEQTSFDHYSIKRTITRTLRCLIKLIDYFNCRNASLVVTNSAYSKYILKKIYNINSFVIRPGIEYLPPKKTTNSKMGLISIGLISMIKGYDFSLMSINMLKRTKKEYTIIGRNTDDTNLIIKRAKALRIRLNLQFTENNKEKNKLLKSNKIYLSNQLNEPFGISTLEGCNCGLFALGKNTGGTPEIIEHGLNGILYPDNIILSSILLSKYVNQKKINFYKTCKINWNEFINKIILVTTNVINE